MLFEVSVSRGHGASIKQAKQIRNFEIAVETNNQQHEVNMGKRDII